jgi:hypothetical protein
MLSIYVADKKQTHGKNRSRKCWKIEKLCFFERHLESDKNLFFYEICPIEIQAQFKKQNAKRITIISNTCKKNFPFFEAENLVGF